MRMSQAPYVRKAVPDTTKGWHHRQMPTQAKIPGLPQLMPPAHLEYDKRFKSLKRQMLRDQEKERPDQADAAQDDPEEVERQRRQEERDALKEEKAIKDMVEELLEVRRIHARRSGKRKALEEPTEEPPLRRSPRLSKGKGREIKDGGREETATEPAKGKHMKGKEVMRGKQVEERGSESSKDPRTKGKQRQRSVGSAEAEQAGPRPKEKARIPAAVSSLPP